MGERHAYQYAHTRDRVCKPEDGVIRECFQAGSVAVHLRRIRDLLDRTPPAVFSPGSKGPPPNLLGCRVEADVAHSAVCSPVDSEGKGAVFPSPPSTLSCFRSL